MAIKLIADYSKKAGLKEAAYWRYIDTKSALEDDGPTQHVGMALKRWPEFANGDLLFA